MSIIGVVLLLVPVIGLAYVKGIYITQSTLENTSKIKHIVKQAKKTEINTFVVDIKHPSTKYERNIRYIQNHGLKYVARVVVFPGGGNVYEVKNKAYWQRRWQLAKYAIDQGASTIQLDYIRYHTKRTPSPRNIEHIKRVINYFHQKLAGTGVKLQIDVFGFTTKRPGYGIGQYPAAFANVIESVSPMVYPSHYQPYRYHSKRPYKTVYNSLQQLKQQLNDSPHVTIVPYIEIWNPRYPMTDRQQIHYFREQLKAVQNANVDGWYVWHARNNYHILFQALQ